MGSYPKLVGVKGYEPSASTSRTSLKIAGKNAFSSMKSLGKTIQRPSLPELAIVSKSLRKALVFAAVDINIDITREPFASRGIEYCVSLVRAFRRLTAAARNG